MKRYFWLIFPLLFLLVIAVASVKTTHVDNGVFVMPLEDEVLLILLETDLDIETVELLIRETFNK